MTFPPLLRLPALLSLAALSLPFSAARLDAGTISLNYRANGGSTAPELGAADVAGVEPAANWNNRTHAHLGPGNPDSPAVTNDLNDAAGTPTTADLTVTASTTAAGPSQDLGDIGSDENMLFSPKSIGSNRTPGPAPGDTITITGAEIPYPTYDVIVYLTDQRNNNENTGVAAILFGGPTYYLQTPEDDLAFFNTNGFVRSADAIDDGAFSNDTANYVRFEAVTASSFQVDLVTTQGNTTSDSSRLGIGGVQIVEVSVEDSDNDGLPDTYEQQLIDFDLGDAVDGLDDVAGPNDEPGFTTDFDSDGSSDAAEFANLTNPTAGDTDNDFSRDGEEATNGTNPLKPDSDNDGLLDGYETNDDNFVSPTATGSDPLDPDSDDDGINDGVEVERGSNPNDPGSTPSTGATISLNWRAPDVQEGAPADFVLVPTDLLGVIPAANWNDGMYSNLSAPVTVTDLTDSDGNATTADLTISATTDAAGPGLGVSPPDDLDANMLLSGKSIGSNLSPGPAPGDTITIAGAEIPYPLYDVIVYLTDQRINVENTGVQATLSGGDTYYLQTPHDDRAFFRANGFVRSADTVDDGAFTNATANYVHFEGVPGSSFQIDLVTTQGNTTSDSSRLGVGGIQITRSSGPPQVRLTDVSFASGTGTLSISWESRDGKLYNLRSETDPSSASSIDWPIFNGNADLAATPPENTLTIPLPADSLRLFVIEEFDAPPLQVFSDDFEDGQGLWTTGRDDQNGNTLWQLGAPSVTGPATANSPTNCFATNISGDYDFHANIWLRSPPLDLPAAGAATLSYFEFKDIEESFDSGRIAVLDANDDSVLAVIKSGIDGDSANWAEVIVPVPPEALGKSVKLEFRFASDDVTNLPGWYLDDVQVTVP